ncbi:hypothetical protein HDU85_005274 [Gaertneriomyces sp. JEL0708]|nr:hypothetical protein HDU85_005274 [Gaertneriomyces sp. JEL0708]
MFRATLLSFYTSHLVFITFVTTQTIFPVLRSYFPKFLVSSYDAWVAISDDPYLKDVLVHGSARPWFWGISLAEGTIQAIMYLFLIKGVYKKQYSSIRTLTLLYTSHIATTMIPILADLLLGPYKHTIPAQKLAIIMSAYLPYLIIPLGIMYKFTIGWDSLKKAESNTKKKRA